MSSLADPPKPRVSLIGPAAQALSGDLVRQGFVIGDGGAAVVDLSAPGPADGCWPVIGLAADGVGSGAFVDAVARDPLDVPLLLRTLIRAGEDRDELARQTEDLSALVEVTSALAAGGDPEQLLARVVKRIAGRLTVERARRR